MSRREEGRRQRVTCRIHACHRRFEHTAPNSLFTTTIIPPPRLPWNVWTFIISLFRANCSQLCNNAFYSICELILLLCTGRVTDCLLALASIQYTSAVRYFRPHRARPLTTCT